MYSRVITSVGFSIAGLRVHLDGRSDGSVDVTVAHVVPLGRRNHPGRPATRNLVVYSGEPALLIVDIFLTSRPCCTFCYT